MKPLQDYLMHYIIKKAEEINIPIKIHTGIQEGKNYVTNSNPTLLLEILNEYKNVNFVLLHGGYPYINEAISIAKYYPNVYLDTCWLHIISPTASRFNMHQLIEAIPSNKVFGFGGDYYLIEGALGHLIITKRNIARVLSEKIDENYFSKKQAIKYALDILYYNPKELFRI